MSDLREHVTDLVSDAVHDADCAGGCVCLLDQLQALTARTTPPNEEKPK